MTHLDNLQNGVLAGFFKEALDAILSELGGLFDHLISMNF